MNRLYFLTLVLFCAFNVQAQGVDDNSAFAKANKAYTAENYEVAIAAYNQILESGKPSAEVYFNLGNSYYKLNQVGEAIYHYEKALQLSPEDRDVLTNLRFAEQMKIDAIEPLPENAIGSSVDNLVTSLTVDEWAYLSIVIVLLTILMAILYIYSGTTGKKRLFFVLMIFGIIISILTIMAAFYARNHVDEQQYAIVMVEEINGRESPKQSSPSVFTIHEGTKIKLLEEFEGWSRIALANGSKAWVPEDVYREL